MFVLIDSHGYYLTIEDNNYGQHFDIRKAKVFDKVGIEAELKKSYLRALGSGAWSVVPLPSKE